MLGTLSGLNAVVQGCWPALFTWALAALGAALLFGTGRVDRAARHSFTSTNVWSRYRDP